MPSLTLTPRRSRPADERADQSLKSAQPRFAECCAIGCGRCWAEFIKVTLEN